MHAFRPVFCEVKNKLWPEREEREKGGKGMGALSQILRDGSHSVGVASCVVAVWMVVGQGGLLKTRI